MDYKILIVRNRIKYAIDSEAQRFIGWLNRHTPFNISLTYLDTDLPLIWKNFGAVPFATYTFFGLDGIKEELRPIVRGSFNSMFFIYEATEYPVPGRITAWTYPNQLNDAEFSEIPIQLGSLTIDLYRFLSHEIIHQFHRNLWRKGVQTVDDMDLYDKDFDPDAPDGNRARNLKRIEPWWGLIAGTVLSYILYLLSKLSGLLAQLKAQRDTPVPTPQPHMNKIKDMALAIQKFEGYKPGTLSYRNNNPGNFKFTNFVRDYLGGSQGASGFAAWPNYEQGFNALCAFLTMCAQDKVKGYHGVTLLEFFAVYAPKSDNNDPENYANFVAGELKVAPQTRIKELL